jgi:Spy/CpxP family protein refolding chaperone
MKLSIAMTLALGLFFTTQATWAQPGPEDAPPVLKKLIMRELGLNDDQIKKIEDLTYRADREKLDIRHELQTARLDLQHLMSADQPNEAAVFSTIETISKLELKLKKNRVGLMLKIRKLLTRKQWEKLEMFQARRKANRRERRERRRRLRTRRDIPAAPEPPEPPEPPPVP